MASKLSPAEKVAAYIKLRDHKKAAEDEFKKSMERVNNAMEVLEGELLQHLTDTGASSLACDAGTVYRNTRTNASVQDRAAFFRWAMDGREEAMDIKANSTFVREHMDETGEPVPGVKVTQMHTVGVRRS